MTASVRANWRLLTEPLQSLNTLLVQTPENKVFLPDHITTAIKQLDQVMDIVVKQNLHVVGSINLNQKLRFIENRLKGIQYGLEGTMQPDRAVELLQITSKEIEPVFDELSLKSDKQLLNSIVTSAKEKVKAAGDINTDDFNNLTDAMQSVVRKLGNADSISGIDKKASQDVINISKIMKRNESDLQAIKTAINKVRTDPDDEENFAITYGPILTGAKLDPIKLKNANMDYDTVYFPGIRYGFTRKEETPRYYILRNQMLVAILIGSLRPRRFHLKLKNTPIQKKIKREDASFKEISNDIPQLLSNQLGYTLVHVGAERGAYITSKQFPGVRFMWLMPKTVYDRIGPFSSSYLLELPF